MLNEPDNGGEASAPAVATASKPELARTPFYPDWSIRAIHDRIAVAVSQDHPYGKMMADIFITAIASTPFLVLFVLALVEAYVQHVSFISPLYALLYIIFPLQSLTAEDVIILIVGAFVFTFVGVFVWSIVYGGIVHFFLLLFGGTGSFRHTAGTIAYSSRCFVPWLLGCMVLMGLAAAVQSPALAVIAGLTAVIFYIHWGWFYLVSLAEVHGFRRLGAFIVLYILLFFVVHGVVLAAASP